MVRWRLIVVAVLGLAGAAGLTVGSAGCGGAPARSLDRRGEVTGRSFEFGGGNENEEWSVRVRGDSLWIAVDRRGTVTELGVHQLLDEEAEALWEMVEEAKLGRRKSTTRNRGEAGENLFMFVQQGAEAGLRDAKVPVVELWADEVYADEKLTDLIQYIAELIQRKTGKKATL